MSLKISKETEDAVETVALDASERVLVDSLFREANIARVTLADTILAYEDAWEKCVAAAKRANTACNDQLARILQARCGDKAAGPNGWNFDMNTMTFTRKTTA